MEQPNQQQVGFIAVDVFIDFIWGESVMIYLNYFQIEDELANYGLAANQIRWLSNNALSLEEGRHRFKVNMKQWEKFYE